MSLRHAILGFLAEAPLSGYDLRKHMEASVAHFWPADQTQIYRTLARLVEDGLVDVNVIRQDGRPDRREHHLRPEGLAELDAWLNSPAPYEPTREPFLLRVFFAGRLGPEHALRLLDERAADANELLRELRGVRQQVQASLARDVPLEQRLRLATLDNGVAHVEAELAWIHQTRRLVGEQA